MWSNREQQDSCIDTDAAAREQRFWLGQLYAGLAGYLAYATTVAVYVALTWSQPNRGWLALLAAGTAASSLICYCLRLILLEKPYKILLFGIGNSVAFVVALLACALDGGADSPLVFLVFPPMLYLAIRYPLRVVLICGAFGLAASAVLVGLSPESTRDSAGIVQLMALAIGFVLAMVGARTRDRKDQEWYELRQRLIAAASTDQLTACLNQRAFEAELREETVRAVRYQHSLALLMIDIDHFKRVNDECGHPMGDQVLREVAGVLRQTARAADFVGRPGGDELALLAPETDSEGARVLAERLRSRLKSHSLPVAVTLSIGVYAAVPETETATSVLHRADQALYGAKRSGRDRIVLWGETVAPPEPWSPEPSSPEPVLDLK